MAVTTGSATAYGDLHAMVDRLEAERPRRTVVVAPQDATRVREAYEQLQRDNPLCARLEIHAHPSVSPGQALVFPALVFPAGPEPASGVSAPGDPALSGKINGPEVPG
jgi:hypothetical protein